jgi:protein-arginine kinase activator protein McsA
MESLKEFYCHNCKKVFKKVLSDDDEATCINCADPFVEMIEDQVHL